MNRTSIAVSFVGACVLFAAVTAAFIALVPEPSAVALWAVTLVMWYLVSRYQRHTGPGYDIPASCTLGGERVGAWLPTSSAGDGDCPVRLRTNSEGVTSVLAFRRYRTSDGWSRIPFERAEDGMVAFVPHQPAAGKIEYHIEVASGAERQTLPKRDNVIVRFRGQVAPAVLLPHVLLVLAGMILSIRAGLETWFGGPQQTVLANITLAALLGGGMVFGPLVQKGAFGKYWTGFPLGTDLTDTKMLVVVLAWTGAVSAAALALESAGSWRLVAASITLVAFLIPHSLFGSELRYEG